MLRDLLSYMNFTFTMCFTFECVLKLIAFGPGVSRQKKWQIGVKKVEFREREKSTHTSSTYFFVLTAHMKIL